MSNLPNEDIPKAQYAQYKHSAQDVVQFKIAYNSDYDDNCPFKPDMAHQIFGERESIFGYRDISIELVFAHNSYKCFLKHNYSGKIVDFEADDYLEKLNPWLPAGFVTDKDEFKRILEDEEHASIFGDILGDFKVKHNESENKSDCKYVVSLCDATNEKFREVHERFETLIVWFIDAANFIDLDDPKWMIFYVYEEFLNSGETIRSPVGFCSIYKFLAYPDKTRARISQFFILPTHHKRSIGSKFYEEIVKYLRKSDEILDITVEEPIVVFQKMRDCCDSKYVLNYLNENNYKINTMHSKKILQLLREFKFCKKQSTRLIEILKYYAALQCGPKTLHEFTKTVKDRITKEIMKEQRIKEKMFKNDGLPSQALLENVDSMVAAYLETLKPVAKKLLNLD